MAVPSTQIIATWILNHSSNNHWLPLKDVAVKILKTKMQKKSESEILELVEQELHHIAEDLRNRCADNALNGEVLVFEIDDQTSPYVKTTNIQLLDIKNKLQTINPEDFEVFCAKLLNNLGGTAHTTPQTHDGGVDFYAFEFTYNSDIVTPKFSKAVVIGQAKRFSNSNHVREKDLREFVGSSIHKLEQFRNDKKIGALSPVVYAFWTTSEIEPRAKRYAQAMGLWIMNGSTLADYVIKNNMQDYLDSLLK